eukprot:10874397-Alexandrium_andersonii.AAC.1
MEKPRASAQAFRDALMRSGKLFVVATRARGPIRGVREAAPPRGEATCSEAPIGRGPRSGIPRP